MNEGVNMLSLLQGAVSLGLLWAIMTIGVFITYRILDIADLSVEGTIALGAAVAARMISDGYNPFLATLVALLAGCLGGLVTGLLHTKLRIPAILSGILTMIACYSINIRVMGLSSNISLLRMDTVFSPLERLGLSPRNAVIVLGLGAVILICLFLYWFFGTELGCAIRATGNNRSMVRAQGIHTDNMVILGLVLSNGLVALSGALICQNGKFANVDMGTGAIVIGLASVIIGEVLFGTKTFWRTLISLTLGAVVYRIIIALVLELGMQSTDLKLFTAITVALALALPMFKSYLSPIRNSLRRGGSEHA